MDMKSLFQSNPLLAILRNVELEKTIDYAEAIVNGGVKVFEVAMNSEHACKQIRMLREHFSDDVTIGAGTAITVERAKAAVESGAQFLLSPSTDLEVLDYCEANHIPLMPGVMTPSDVANCVRRGFYVLKLFPAGDLPSGYVKSLKGPLDGTEYVAIGGVTADNIGSFFRQGYLGVGLGSAILPKEHVASGNWEACSEYVRMLLRKIQEERRC